VKELLRKYVDFSRLKSSPVRLLVNAVNVETAEIKTFDSHIDDLTPDHILASGSLPPGFPWTNILDTFVLPGNFELSVVEMPVSTFIMRKMFHSLHQLP
jgi:predicted acylesterase/phospholipase RssA